MEIYFYGVSRGSEISEVLESFGKTRAFQIFGIFDANNNLEILGRAIDSGALFYVIIFLFGNLFGIKYI